MRFRFSIPDRHTLYPGYSKALSFHPGEILWKQTDEISFRNFIHGGVVGNSGMGKTTMLRFFICQILLNHPRAKLTILDFKKGSELSRLSKIGKYNITVSSNFQSARNALETVWQEYEKRTAYL